jgi:hypothetical protein
MRHTLEDAMDRTIFRPILLLLTVALPAFALGAVSGGFDRGAGADCRSVSQYVSDNWWDLRSVMAADFGARKPRQNDLRCVSPTVTQEMRVVRVPAHSRTLQCYARGAAAGVCCDRGLNACVSYSGQ